MARTRVNYNSVPFRISLGFAGTAVLLFAITHTGISYLFLLFCSAIYDKLPIDKMKRLSRGLNPIHAFSMIGILSSISLLATPFPAFAQWNGAQTAAQETLGTHVGEPTVTLLFTVVFLLLFFLIMGGLMAWGYKAFRNEDAAVPMTAFIVGTVIFVGGEVFSALFFGESGA